eukprot:2776118-Rhodomonas_salina.1
MAMQQHHQPGMHTFPALEIQVSNAVVPPQTQTPTESQSSMAQEKPLLGVVRSFQDACMLLNTLKSGGHISPLAHTVLTTSFSSVFSHSMFESHPQPQMEHVDLNTDDISRRRDDVPSAGHPASPPRKSLKRHFKPAGSKARQLTAEEAAEVYTLRPNSAKGLTLRRGGMIQCKSIAPQFGVTAKTIRDIWHGRTWATATKHLWSEEEKKRREEHGADQDIDEGKDESDELVSPSESPKASDVQDAGKKSEKDLTSAVSSPLVESVWGSSASVPSMGGLARNSQFAFPQVPAVGL